MCSSLNEKRKQILQKVFMKRHNVIKIFELKSTKTIAVTKIMYIIKHINNVFCTPGLPTVVL
jgi:hypothetical protein